YLPLAASPSAPDRHDTAARISQYAGAGHPSQCRIIRSAKAVGSMGSGGLSMFCTERGTPTPTPLTLAFDEIRQFGMTSIQVMRRLRAASYRLGGIDHDCCTR